jgi:hypothetical protein
MPCGKCEGYKKIYMLDGKELTKREYEMIKVLKLPIRYVEIVACPECTDARRGKDGE